MKRIFIHICFILLSRYKTIVFGHSPTNTSAICPWMEKGAPWSKVRWQNTQIHSLFQLLTWLWLAKMRCDWFNEKSVVFSSRFNRNLIGMILVLGQKSDSNWNLSRLSKKSSFFLFLNQCSTFPPLVQFQIVWWCSVWFLFIHSRHQSSERKYAQRETELELIDREKRAKTRLKLCVQFDWQWMRMAGQVTHLHSTAGLHLLEF